ncbi:MAG: hypothetical protein GTO40_28455, partial [Deltaproteobacteria bacterium]|nr:hypothetical protein [Deltaproteobacteria bacterium]
DTNGNIKWQQTYGSGVARAVIETTDGGFVFTGYHGVLVKTDANGIEEWRRIFSGDIEDFCYSVIQTRDGGFALAGFTFNPFITLPGDTTPPTVSSPANIVYEEGMERMTGYVIAWTVGDRNPGTYDLLSNNSVCVDSASWTNGTITWEVDDLTPGTYNFTLIVRDLNRNRTLDTIWVTVFATANPELSAPEDIAVEEGTSSRVITWAVGDRFPGTYAIYTNSEQVDSGSWTNGTITWGVDGLTPGTYNVTLVVRDMAQNCVSDTIWVTVFT